MTLLGSAAKLAVNSAAKRLAARLPSARTTELFNEMVQDAALYAEGFVGKLVERMGGDPEEAAARLSALVTEKEMTAFVARLLPEIVGSPTEERRRMLGAALAGVYHPDFSIEDKSRITRAVSMLEPSDVIVLKATPPITWMHQGGPFGRKVAWGPRVVRWKSPTREEELSLGALQSAGCIAVSTHEDGRPLHDRTPLGESVLKFLADCTAENVSVDT